MFEPHLSEFDDVQFVTANELSSELPTGCLPRTMTLILRGSLCGRLLLGDVVDCTGELIAIPTTNSLISRKQAAELGVKLTKQHDGRQSSTQINQQLSSVSGMKGLGVRDLSYKRAFIVNFLKAAGQQVPLTWF